MGKNCETDETNLSRVRDDVDGGDGDDDDGDGYSDDDGGDGDGGPIQVGKNCERDETNLSKEDEYDDFEQVSDNSDNYYDDWVDEDDDILMFYGYIEERCKLDVMRNSVRSILMHRSFNSSPQNPFEPVTDEITIEKLVQAWWR